jgi:hypothetical protein
MCADRAAVSLLAVRHRPDGLRGDLAGQPVAVVSVPQRHWRSYDNEPLPTPAEALGEPLAAFPSWFLRIGCDRCGKVRMGSGSSSWRRINGQAVA